MKLIGGKTKNLNTLILFCLIMIAPCIGQTAVIFNEDFEYGQEARDLSALEGIPAFRNIWNGDNQTGDGTLAVNSSQRHTGGYSGYVHTGTGASTHFEANYSYGNNYYIDMWIYPLSSSTIGNNNKLIYAYTSATGESIWCLKVSKGRIYTGNCSYGWEAQNQGWSLHYVGPGAATSETGLNNLMVKYLLEDRWNRIVFHVNQVSTSRTDLELWIDNGDGNRLEKVGETSVTSPECVAQRNGITRAGRLKFGLMSDSWMNYQLDDVIVATSANDIAWDTSSIPSPTIIATDLNTANVNDDYSVALTATNGTSPYSWDIVSGALPNGITIDESTGELHGIATETGNYSFVARVTDANFLTDQEEFALVVNEPTQTEILLNDNFEQNDLTQWIGPWGEIGSSDPDYGFITSTDSSEGTHSFQETIPAYQPEGGKLRYSFSDNPKRKLYTRFYYKCSSPWDPLTANKLLILLAGNVPAGPTSADLQVIYQIVHYEGSQLGEFQVVTSNYINGNTQYHNWRQNVGTPVVRQTERWYKIEMIVDAGTPGNSDGMIQMYIDDDLKANYENINLLPNTTYSQEPLFHWAILTNMADALPDNGLVRHSWYDDFVLATERISPENPDDIQNVSLPSTPTGLSISFNQ